LVANGTGSSAGRQFAQLSPADVCLAAPIPILFTSSEVPPNMVEWQCTVSGGNTATIRYSATNSRDGYVKQPNGVSATASYLNVATCPAPVNQANYKGTGKTVAVSTCAAGTPTQNLVVHWGGADVNASSLHQSIFGASTIPPADGHLTTTATVEVPFS